MPFLLTILCLVLCAADAGAHPHFSAPDTAAAESLAARPRPTIPARAGSAVMNLGSDAWYILTSPARLNRHGLLVTGGLLAVGGVLYAYDDEIYQTFIRNRGDPVYEAVLDVGRWAEPVGFMGNTNPIYVATYVVGSAAGIEPLQEISLQILESHIIAGGLRNLGRLLIGRRRPFEDKGPRFFEINGGTSFPSGHTSVVFELATILSHHVRSTPFTVLAFAVATTVALERVDSNTHWPSDVYLAAVSGHLIARTVVERHEQRSWALVPTAGSGGVGFRVFWGF